MHGLRTFALDWNWRKGEQNWGTVLTGIQIHHQQFSSGQKCKNKNENKELSIKAEHQTLQQVSLSLAHRWMYMRCSITMIWRRCHKSRFDRVACECACDSYAVTKNSDISKPHFPIAHSLYLKVDTVCDFDVWCIGICQSETVHNQKPDDRSNVSKQFFEYFGIIKIENQFKCWARRFARPERFDFHNLWLPNRRQSWRANYRFISSLSKFDGEDVWWRDICQTLTRNQTLWINCFLFIFSKHFIH